MNDKRHKEHTVPMWIAPIAPCQVIPWGRFFNAAVAVLWSWLCLAVGGLSLLAMLPFMVMGRIVRKKGQWI